eukprot:6491220-Amphidinium_carterae.1
MAQELAQNGVEYRESSNAPNEVDEPQTSARPLRPYDMEPDDLQTPPAEQEFRGRETHATDGSRHRDDGSQPRSRSRSRAILFVQPLSEDDDSVLMGLEQCAQFSEMSFESADVVEYVTLMSTPTKAEIKRRKEIVYHRLSLEHQSRFQKAMRDEMTTNILRPHASQLLSVKESRLVRENAELRRRIIPTRWVLVEKDVGEDLPTQAKARLVLQGFKDPDIGDLEVSSPTLSKDALPLLLIVIASMKWTLFIADVKGAFMTSRPLDREGGALYASLPKMWDLHDIALPEQLILVKVAWYGLNDGPKEFYETLVADLFRLGCRRSALDPCVFMWFQDNKLQGVVGLTVDDVLGGGTEKFHKSVIEVLGQRFPFGKVKWKGGRFTGRDVQQQEDYSIHVSQDFYLDSIQPADIPRKRRCDKSSALSDGERTLLRAKAGELNWLQGITRPDLSGAVSLLQTSFGDPTIESLLEANRIIKEAKANKMTIRYPSIPLEAIRFACTADSAWANTPDLASHMGYMIFLTDQRLDMGQDAPFAPVLWKAHKQKRKAVSTLSAEAMATGESLGSLDWTRVLFEELTRESFKLDAWESLISGRPSVVLTDCKSVFDSLNQLWSSAARTDKRTSIDLAIIRETLTRDASRIRWIDTRFQLVDSLTKRKAPADTLRAAIKRGTYRIVQEALALKLRDDARSQKNGGDPCTL